MGHFKDDIKHGLYFNGARLTHKAIQDAINDFVQIEQGCIDEVKSGAVKVNDKESYFEYCNKWKQRYIDRDFRISLTFLQRAYYFQTGKSIALLP